MKDFKKYYKIPAPPEEVYLALTTPLAIGQWTGEEAVMSTDPGSKFSLWGGNICGVNLEFVENLKIVQHWFFGDQEEDSIVTITLHKEKKHTSLEIRQTNIPDEVYEEFVYGWDNYYVKGLIDFY